MPIFDGCMLVSDIDGTLYADGKIQKGNSEAIERFKSLGGIFTIATGRGPALAKIICRESRANAPVITVNGSVLYDAENEKILIADYLSESVKKMIYDATVTFPDVGLEITLDSSVAVINSTKTSSDYVKEKRSAETYNRYFEKPENIENLNILKVLFMTDNADLLEQLKQFVYARKTDEFTYVNSSTEFFEILTPGTTKAKYLYRLADMMNINHSNVFTIGDYYNDLDMIEKAAVGACVAESPDDIKEKSDYVATSVYNGAVADFINYLEKMRERKK